MNFRPELAAAVMAGQKTVTRRLVSDNPRSPWYRERCGFRIGQRFAVCPGRGKTNIGHAIVNDVERQLLGRLDDDEARREGFDSANAFETAFIAINGDYDRAVEVWRISFEVEQVWSDCGGGHAPGPPGMCAYCAVDSAPGGAA